MMSYFSGCHSLVELISMISIFYISSIIFLQTSSSMAEEGTFNHPLLYRFSSREEMVQLAGYGEDKLSTMLIRGTVLCEVCLHGEPYLRSWPISGALISLNCHTGRKWSRVTSVQIVTDEEYGDFLMDVPSHLHAIPNLDRTCSVKVSDMPENSLCRPTLVDKDKALVLSSLENGIRIYTAGKMDFLDSMSRPLQVCNKRASSDEQVDW